MRRLLLLRHAEADPSGPTDRDADRPLSAEGRGDAARMAAWVAAWLDPESAGGAGGGPPTTGPRTRQLLCSTARRARETLEPLRAALERRIRHRIGSAGSGPLRIRLRDDLYLASRRDLVQALEALPDDVVRLVLIGHNPGLSELAAWLDPDARPGSGLAPGSAAELALRTESWSDLAPGAAEWVRTVAPDSVAGGTRSRSA